jgi:hypothetical protein
MPAPAIRCVADGQLQLTPIGQWRAKEVKKFRYL